MAFAVPPSGSLCLELLRQMKSPAEQEVFPPRSKMIQSLSLLVAFLEWVKPSAPNADLCQRTWEILDNVLSQVLGPRVSNSSQPTLQMPEEWNWDFQSDFQLFEDLSSVGMTGTFDWLS